MNLVFDTWWAQMQATLQTYLASGLIKLPGVSTKYTLTGGLLTSYKPAPNAKRLLQPRTFGLTWQSIAPRAGVKHMTDMPPSEKCRRCGGDHDLFTCPHVKAIDLDDAGRIARIEFLTPIDLPRQQLTPDGAIDGDNYPRMGRRTG